MRITDTPGSSSRSPSAQPSAPQSATSRSSGWSYEATSLEFAAERDLPLRALGDDPRPRERPRARPPAAGRRRGRSGGGSSRRRRRSRGRSPPPASPARSACPRTRASRRSSRPAAPRSPSRSSTRPAGVSTSRQLSAWSSRRFASSSPSAHGAPQDPRHRAHDRAGVRPERPGLDERDASCRRRGRVRQWTASLCPPSQPAGPTAVLVGVDRRRRGLALALVLRAELLGAVRPLHRASSSGRS